MLVTIIVLALLVLWTIWAAVHLKKHGNGCGDCKNCPAGDCENCANKTKKK